MAVVRCLMNLAKVPNDAMIHSPNRILPTRSVCEEDSGRVQYWVIWSLGQRNKFISHPTTAIKQLTFGHKACPALEHESDGHLSLLPRLRGLDSAECIRAHVRLIKGARTSKIVAPQYVEDLSDQFNLSGFAKNKRLADPEIEPGEHTAVDLALRDRGQAERCAICVDSGQHGGGVPIAHVLRRSGHVVGVGAVSNEVDACLGAEGVRRPEIPACANNDLTGQLPGAAEYELMPAIGVRRTGIEASIVVVRDHASNADPYQVGASKVAILLRTRVRDLVLVIV